METYEKKDNDTLIISTTTQVEVSISDLLAQEQDALHRVEEVTKNLDYENEKLTAIQDKIKQAKKIGIVIPEVENGRSGNGSHISNSSSYERKH